MTGGVHNNDSQDLYFKQVYDNEIIDKLIPTKNQNYVPPATILRNKIIVRIIAQCILSKQKLGLGIAKPTKWDLFTMVFLHNTLRLEG